MINPTTHISTSVTASLEGYKLFRWQEVALSLDAYVSLGVFYIFFPNLILRKLNSSGVNYLRLLQSIITDINDIIALVKILSFISSEF